MTASPSPAQILSSMASRYSWGPDSGQTAGILHIGSALHEKNRIELLRLRHDMVKSTEEYPLEFRTRLANELMTEL